ncbi:MAG: N-acetylmuramic acid 6-phosphate etherase [Oscillospiraceae bacterium]|jgi:N-acetylmuramic acid 6-phosphate etherase|nr:N-acetylmuramic acid 6-phosphate etherase [Oscillospiraceae bacterium]
MIFERIDRLSTEKRNLSTLNIDRVSTIEFVEIFNEQNLTVMKAIEDEKENIVSLIEKAVSVHRNRGNIIFIGAGASGITAIRCVDEYKKRTGENDRFQAIMPGSLYPVEAPPKGVEDDPNQGERDVKDATLLKRDLIIAVSASGRTPYTIGAIQYASKIGIQTAGITCNTGTALSGMVDYLAELNCGPEVIMGATWLRSAAAEKALIDMIISAVMISDGDIYSNLIFEKDLGEEKIIERQKRVIMYVSGVDYDVASRNLERADNDAKAAAVMSARHCDRRQAETLLEECAGHVRQAIELEP